MLRVYLRRISIAIRSDAVRRIMQCVAPQVLEGLTDSFAVPAVARDCSQCDHPTDEPVQCHLQQEHEMQCRGTLRRLPLLCPSLALSSPGFDPRSAHVRFMVDSVAVGKSFLPVLWFRPVSSLPRPVRIHSSTPVHGLACESAFKQRD